MAPELSKPSREEAAEGAAIDSNGGVRVQVGVSFPPPNWKSWGHPLFVKDVHLRRKGKPDKYTKKLGLDASRHPLS